MCNKPLYKGFYTIEEALQSARESLGYNFYIEPEEVKNFAAIAQQDPNKLISDQAELIKSLENQVVNFRNENFQLNSRCQEFSKQLEYKEKTVETMERVIKGLNYQISLLNNKFQSFEQKIKTESSSISNRSFEQLKARIIDMPFSETLKPVLDKFPEFERLVISKVNEEFIQHLILLQQEIVDIHFNPSKYMGINVVQGKDRREFIEAVPGLLKLKIDLNKTTMPIDTILKFYHNGMVDFIEFKTNNKILDLLKNFGEKFFLIAGNIAEQCEHGRIFIKIISSLPEVINESYRPARKLVTINEVYRQREGSTVLPYEFNMISDEKIYKFYQQSESMKDFEWTNYRLYGEGHYVQIWAHPDWRIKLPFHGEGEQLAPDKFFNISMLYSQDPYGSYDQDDEITIPDTHRD